MSRLHLTAAVVVAVFTMPAAAHAAEASVSYVCGGHECALGTVSYQLGEGERAALAIAGGPDGVTLRDPGNAVRPGHGCVAIAPDAVDCPGRLHAVWVRLGTGDDAVDASALTGFGAEVFGLGGSDRVTGGPGGDVFFDGDLGAGNIGPDVFDGGGGLDHVIYDGRRGDLRVDLTRQGEQGERGENDVLRAVERVTGGLGDDVLRAPARGGRLACGPGRDRVERAGRRDTLGGDCERVTVGRVAASSPSLELSLGRALRVVRADCPDRRCGAVTLRRGPTVARMPLRQSARGRPGQILRLPRAMRRRLVDVRFSRGGGFRWISR